VAGNSALVIGIDHYAAKGWSLKSAVSDALRFAAWCVTRGGVDPANLRLHLAEKGGNASGRVALPGTSVQADYKPAQSLDIVDTIQYEFRRDGLGKGGDRLYVYYAGHGSSHPGVRGKHSEPVLIPADVRDPGADYKRLISFSELIEPLRYCGPLQQFFFFDACRDFALDGQVETGGTNGRYIRPLSILAEPSRKQYAIYATAPGERASELGKGVFGAALLAALELDPRAILRIAGAGRYELQFSPMFDFIRAETARTIEGSIPVDAARFVQTPESDPEPREPNPVLRAVDEAEVREAELLVRVGPNKARDGGTLTVYYDQYRVGDPVPPPLSQPVVVRLKPAYYRVQVDAAGFVTERATVLVPPAEPLEIAMKAALEEETILIEGHSSTTTEPPRRIRNLPKPAPPPARPKQLRVFLQDQAAVIVVWKPDGSTQTGQGSVRIAKPAPGVYRAHLITPEGRKIERLIDFPAEGGEIELKALKPAIGVRQTEWLEKAGIHGMGEYLEPSESMGPMANVRLASLLGFAAYAVNAAPASMMSRLRSLGVAQVPAGSPQLLLLVGASGSHPAGAASVAKFLAGCRVGGSEDFRLAPLAKFPSAGQLAAPVANGASTMDLQMPGVPIMRHAIAGLKDRVTVLVVVVNDDGSTESQLYLFPRRGSPAPPLSPDALRTIEQAQRFYQGSEPMPEPVMAGMLHQLLPLKWVDPVLGCLAGYTLLRHGRANDLRGVPLANMLAHFDAVPDVHVLAALCEPDQADRHFKNAMQRGIPLFAEGFRAMLDHFRKTGQAVDGAAARAGRTLAGGAALSSWIAWEPVLRVKGKSIEKPPYVWRVLESRRKEIEKVLPATGLLKGESITAGTGFLVAPDLVLTASFMAEAWIEDPTRVRFQTANDPAASAKGAVKVAEILEIDAPHMLALLRLAKPLGVEPIRIAGPDQAPDAEARVYLAGYPHSDWRIDRALSDAVIGQDLGVKRVAPGEYFGMEANGRDFSHDAFTAPGNGGSPVIDLGTGVAIGLEHSSRMHYGAKIGYATALWRLWASPVLQRIQARSHGERPSRQ
jgi:hypothetical protein